MNSSYHDSQALLEQQRQRLETGLHPQHGPIVHPPSRWRQLVEAVGQALANWLTRGDSIQISRTTRGNAEVWKVYDPFDHSIHYFDQEDDVRAYLERRYYL